MPKLKKKQLRDQFTVRIYSEDDSSILKKAYQRFQTGFDSISDFIRHCVIVGAEKLMSDNDVDQRLNLDEIKTALYSVNEKLAMILSKMTFNTKDQQVENYLMEDLLNYIANIAYLSDCNKAVISKDTENGLFDLYSERNKAIVKVFNDK
jgi:hypothetical protein